MSKTDDQDDSLLPVADPDAQAQADEDASDERSDAAGRIYREEEGGAEPSEDR